MAEDRNDQEQPETPEDSASTTPPKRPPSSAGRATSGMRAALSKRDARGRPLAVYAILGAVVAVLALLMIIVYFSDSDRSQVDQPICTTIDVTRAANDIREGEVAKVTVGYDETAIIATDPTWGPVLARLDYQDGACANLPQGVANQEGILAVIGAITFYNETTDSAQVELVYNEMADLDASLFAVPTEDVPVTPEPTEVPATPTPTPEPTAPVASPAASPAGTPVAPLSETPTATP